MTAEKLIVSIPGAVAADLEQAGAADRLPTARTDATVAAVAVTAFQVVSTLVTIGQTPGVLQDLAERLRTWRDHHDGEDPVLTINAEGPAGRVQLHLTRTTSAKDISGVLNLLLPEAERDD